MKGNFDEKSNNLLVIVLQSVVQCRKHTFKLNITKDPFRLCFFKSSVIFIKFVNTSSVNL